MRQRRPLRLQLHRQHQRSRTTTTWCSRIDALRRAVRQGDQPPTHRRRRPGRQRQAICVATPIPHPTSASDMAALLLRASTQACTIASAERPRFWLPWVNFGSARCTPSWALFLPLILVFIVDGRRGLRQTWLPALVAGGVFAVAQFVTANYISVRSPTSSPRCSPRGSLVLLVRVWQPAEVVTADPVDEQVAVRTGSSSGAPGSTSDGRTATGTGAGTGAAGRPSVNNRSDVLRAYAPYLVIIVIFSITNIPAVVDFFAKEPFDLPLRLARAELRTLQATRSRDPVQAQLADRGRHAAGDRGPDQHGHPQGRPARALQTYGATYVELRSASSP